MSDKSPEDLIRKVGGKTERGDLVALPMYQRAGINGRRFNAGRKKDPACLPLVFFKDIMPAIDSKDFVEGLLVNSSLVVVYGEPGSGKTFFVLDICLSVAAGKEWRGRAVEQGAVIYLALEGGAGIRNRIFAARKRLELPDDTPFVLVQCQIDLCSSDADMLNIVKTIKDVADKLGQPVRLVVVDTLFRALAGGNENAPEDMGALVANSDKIRQGTDACVILIHHSGKDVTRGSRGHSSLKPATDTEIEITHANGVSIARVTRQRDLEGEDSFAFTLERVELGLNNRGKPVTSCVVEPANVPAKAAAKTNLTTKERVANRCLDTAIREYGRREVIDPLEGEQAVVEIGDWRKVYDREAEPGASRDARRKAFSRMRDALLAKNVIAARDDLIWRVPGPM
jgi:hypothetical protein